MKKYCQYKITLAFAVALNALNGLGMARMPIDVNKQQNNDSTFRKADVATVMPWPSIIDKTTGRRIYQLTSRPGNNMAFYYLFKNQGKVGDVPYLVYRNSFSEPGTAGGITYYSMNLNTGEDVELTRRGMVGSIADVQDEYMYCMEKKNKSDRFYSYVNRYHLSTGAKERIINLNTKYKHSANLTVNADGTKILFFRPERKGITLLCGIIADGTQHVIASGHMSHIQFGPVDPDLYLYINEDYVLKWKRTGFGWVDFTGGFVTNALLNSTNQFFHESNGNLIPSHLHWDADGVPAITAVDTLKPYVKEYNVLISPDRNNLGEVLKYRKVQIKMGEFQTHFNPGPSPNEFVGDGKSADWWHKPGFGKPYIHKIHYDYSTEKMTQIPLADQIGSFWKSGEYEACARYVPGKNIVVWNAFRTLDGNVPKYPTGGKEGDEGWLYRSDNKVKQNVFAVSYATEDASGWDFSADAKSWTASNLTEFGWSDGGFDSACIQGKIGKKAAAIFSPDQINLSCADYSELMIRLKNESSSSLCRIYFTTDKSPKFSEDKMIEVKIGSKMNQYNSFFADFQQNTNWNGILKQLKVCPGSGTSEGQFSIQVIRMLNSDKNKIILNPLF